MFNRHVILGAVATLTLFTAQSALAGQAVQVPNRGLYLGFQVGYSTVNYSTHIFTHGVTASSVNDSGQAVHVFLGYNFNRYFATELGIIYFKKPIFKNVTGATHTRIKIKNNIVYLVGKLNIPVCERFHIYAKLGVGYVVRNGIKSNNQWVLKEGQLVRPVYGVGASYQVARRWIISAGWMQAAGDSGEQLPASNFYGLGVAYRFYG